MRGAAAEGATPVAGAAVERVNSADAKAAEGSPKRQCSDVAVRRAGSAPIWRFISRNRNGGRHCCQPPLRRAKDLPVFVTWKIKPCGLPTRSRSWLTSSGVASDRTTPSLRRSPMAYLTAPPEGSLVFRPSGLSLENPHSGTEVPEPASSGQNRPMFRGPSWGNHSCVPLCSPKFRRTPGAASRERRSPLPAPLPGWPETSPKALPIPAGGDRFFCPFLTLLAVTGFLERLGRPPRSLEDHAPSFRVAEAKSSVISLWIMGISGATVGTIAKPPKSCPSVLPVLPRPSA